MLPNLLIEASAGTGKTHALVERLAAALHAGADPREIVAITFSRAAAGEIFSRFVSRLASSPSDAALLRRVIDTQHQSQIGTVDSFLVRYVQMFPLELGVSGDIKLMESYAHDKARAAAVQAVLRSRDSAVQKILLEAFHLIAGMRAVRSWLERYIQIAGAWHEAFLDHPNALKNVGIQALDCSEDLIFSKYANDKLGLREAIRSMVPRFEKWQKQRGIPTFMEAIRTFCGPLPARVPVKIAQESATKEVVHLMHCWRLLDAIDLGHGIATIMELFEREYASRVRTRGRLTFSDIPRLIARLGPEARLALEYRLDSRIRHWALDEFQDTSHGQWNALSNLVDEALQSDDGTRSAFIVGDSKQAIYGWRNGDVAIFQAQRDSKLYRLEQLNESWRYTTEIADAVNKVFTTRSLKLFGKWTCPEHVAHDETRRGYVKVVESHSKHAEDFTDAIANELNAVRPWERGISCAILVRLNSFGEMLGIELRKRGIPCVWEGESAVLDTPVLQTFVSLVRLSEHPSDTLSYHQLHISPLGRALYPQGMPSPVEISRDIRASLATRGLVRTFQDARSRLPNDTWDDFTESRFADLLRAAASFEATIEPDTRLSAFVEYLKSQRRRGTHSPGSVQIMTIHRSKGLGFDYVILPLKENDGIDNTKDDILIGKSIEGREWMLPPVGSETSGEFKSTAAAFASRLNARIYESLCIYYVAMTRAKTALAIITQPPNKRPGDPRRFSDFVRESGLETNGDELWFKRVKNAASADEAKTPGSEAPRPDIKRPRREKIHRRTPSLLFRSGISAASLFDPSSTRELARAKGSAIHAEWQNVEWLDAQNARTAFERALVKPRNFVELWREKPYEYFAHGQWESGQFDRVVFTRAEDSRIVATVYDFKTNAMRQNESRRDFQERMKQSYEPQMAAYRRAVAALADIPLEDVGAVLLLTATSDAVACVG